jgi:hypothetical protein
MYGKFDWRINMNPRLTIINKLTLACLMSLIAALSNVALGQQSGIDSAAVQKDDSFPLSARYGILFRRLAGTQSGKQESSAATKTAESHYADLLQHQVHLSDEQTHALVEIAVECQRRVADVDARAKTMIAAFRAQSTRPTDSTDEQSTSKPAPPPGLAALEEERNSIIMQSREKLRTALGEEVFQRFEQYLTSHGSGRTFTLPPLNRPAASIQETVTALAADGQIPKKQFRVGEKIVIQIALLNNSSHPISVRQADLNDWFELSRIEGSTRNPVLMQPPGREPETEAGRAEQVQDVQLLPGQQAIVGTFDLSRIQKFLKPGQYVLTAHPHVLLNRPPDKSEFINLTSTDEPVTFEVVP